MLFPQVVPLKSVQAVEQTYSATRVNALKAASRLNVSWQADLEYCQGKNHPEWAWVNQPSVRAALDKPGAVVRYCGNRGDGRHPLPAGTRANALYCDRSCQQAAYRKRVA